jgi:hypothetical protein
MYTSYLAACKPQITQRESTMRDKRIKTQTENASEIGITQRETEARFQTKEATWH